MPVEMMVPTGFEYFGPEQHEQDMREIVADQTDPVKIIAKFCGDWSGELDVAVPLSTKDLYVEREHHSDYLYVTQMSNAIPKIASMPDILGFERPYHAQIQMQRPGSNMPRHKDPAELFENPKRVRVLITLAPWEYGQYLFFNNTVVREWTAGTVYYTDFQNTWHSTTNTSWHTRPLLQITGVPGPKLQKLIAGSDTIMLDI